MTLATALYGVGIKSIQTGTIVLNSVLSNTATISSVNTAKAFVLDNGSSTTAASNVNEILGAEDRLELTNATTVTATVGNVGLVLTVNYTVVEFY